MREIKFRAWDSKEKKMVLPEEYNTGAIINLEGQCGKTFWTLMQYTGLKGKNGKEIYEGDIVRLKFSNHGEDEGIFEIKWDTKVAGYWLENKVSVWQLRIYANNAEIEVIGNIYENPELLKSL